MVEEEEAIVRVQIKPSPLKREVKNQASEARRISISIPNNTWLHNVPSVMWKSSSRSSISLMMIMMACWLPWIWERLSGNTEDINLQELLSMSPCQSSMLMMEVRSHSKSLWSWWPRNLALRILRRISKGFFRILMRITRDSSLRRTSRQQLRS